MLIKKANDIIPAEITPEALYRERRAFMRNAALMIAGAAAYSVIPTKASSAFAQDGNHGNLLTQAHLIQRRISPLLKTSRLITISMNSGLTKMTRPNMQVR